MQDSGRQVGLEARNLHAWRGDRHVIRGLSLQVTPGHCLHLAGPNGVGKTTLIRILAGLIRPEDGSVHWQGEAVARDPDAFHADTAFLGHDNALKADLSPVENLAFWSTLAGRPVAAVTVTLEAFGLQACLGLPTRVLSAGQKRRVALARVALSGADLWLLDEPFTNLDAAGIRLVEAQLGRHLSAGGMAVVAAHQPVSPGQGEVRRMDLS
ncbi:MAG: cytochrome c biogenesis heme-transporting ATPase CcmA [Steroidobacteraceae bacterium]